MRKLVIIQTVVPDYRKGFFKKLEDTLGAHFKLYAGTYYFEKSVKSDHTISHTPLRNIYLFKSKFLFQRGVLKFVKSDELLVLELNPRILSNWLLLLVRALLNKKTVLWGHAWPRKGRFAKSDAVRHLMRTLASSIVVYTKKQQRELKTKMPNKTIYAAPNALLTKSQMVAVTNDPYHLMYVGRLTKAKKIMFLVEAFKETLEQLPEHVQLLIVGDGEEKEPLRSYITNQKIGHRVQLLGHIHHYDTLQELYASTLFSVSPGYVGLSITQSLGFGVPMIVSRNENHSPEIEAVVEEENAIFFETDGIDSFRESILNIYKNRDSWISKRNVISSRCAENYSVEAMAQVFIDITLKDNII